MKNQNGQALVEGVLLMVVMVGILALVLKFLQGGGDGPVVQQLTQGPWGRLSGMIQCGVWKPCGINNSPVAQKNPNTRARTLSLKPN